MTKISELGLCKNECCADKIRAAMKAGTAYGRATPTLSAAMELPEVQVLVEALQECEAALDLHGATYPAMVKGYTHDALNKARAALAQLKEPKP